MVTCSWDNSRIRTNVSNGTRGRRGLGGFPHDGKHTPTNWAKVPCIQRTKHKRIPRFFNRPKDWSTNENLGY